MEDEDLIKNLLEDAMGDAGYTLVIARNGTEALAEMDADATRFRAVMTDIRLENGPDGWDVARHARELVSEMPMVYTSGYSGVDWESKGVPHSAMVPKPFAVAQIITAVSTLLIETDTR